MTRGSSLIEKFFEHGAVHPGFDKEFVSIFDGWLGKENLHRLDGVTPAEWSRFNDFLRLLHQTYELFLVDLEAGECTKINHIEMILESQRENMDKSSAQFTRIVIAELDVVCTEDWDFTWILWHRNKGEVAALAPLIHQAGLFHWHDVN